MTGAEHKRQAEHLLAKHYREKGDIAEAQVHALLAVAEAVNDLGEHRAELTELLTPSEAAAVRYTTDAAEGAFDGRGTQ